MSPCARSVSSCGAATVLRSTGLDATIEAGEAYGANHLLHLRPQVGGPTIEVDMPARPYEVLGVATKKDWLVEIPPADLHRDARYCRRARLALAHLKAVEGEEEERDPERLCHQQV